ncbi:hypothetical protein GCM10009862_04220 [Microbacterium binotii]|jgi:transposase InsO family protein|uniref:Integrase catalytic domain-containing protein n=1 Tax=Microbacterium binotii TaxID=462710 RepID=A0ABN3PAW3_9MICO
MIRFINEYRNRFGVELICRVLRPAVQGFLTARGYRAAVGRAPSARQLRDSNYMAMVYTDRIVELGAAPSTGTVGDSFDNAMAEAVNNLYKTELIRQRGPWRTVEQVELATLEWVWW